jgi:hypothetical protein
MLEIKNTGTSAVQFHNTEHRLVSVHAGKTRQFPPSEVSPAVVRMFSRQKSIAMRALSDEATALLDKANEVQVPKRPLRRMNSYEHRELLERQQELPPGARRTRDDKNPVEEMQKRFVTDPANPDLPQPANPGAPPPEPPAPEVQTAQPSPAQLLAAAAEADPNFPQRELRRQAKGILLEEYPAGNVTREDLIEILKRKV